MILYEPASAALNFTVVLSVTGFGKTSAKNPLAAFTCDILQEITHDNERNAELPHALFPFTVMLPLVEPH